jgi:hypothetical protein
VGGHEKQSESNTTSTSSSASASASAVSADWLISPSMRNVRVDTQYVGINEEKKIRQLQEELADRGSGSYIAPTKSFFSGGMPKFLRLSRKTKKIVVRDRPRGHVLVTEGMGGPIPQARARWTMTSGCR